jgi:hypothetical protein
MTPVVDGLKIGASTSEISVFPIAGTKGAEGGVIPRHVAETAPGTVDESVFAVAGKGIVHRRP